MKINMVLLILLSALPARLALRSIAGRPIIHSAAQRAIFGGRKKLYILTPLAGIHKELLTKGGDNN
jgi:hypothetical protein